MYFTEQYDPHTTRWRRWIAREIGPRDPKPSCRRRDAELVKMLKEFHAEAHTPAFPYPARAVKMRAGEHEKRLEALDKV
jgi:hypothetical protein